MDFIKKLTSKKKPKPPPQEPPPQQQPTPHIKLHAPNPNATKPKGILKNKNDTQKYTNINAYPTSDDIDESLRNAQKNSSLNQSLTTTQSASPQNESKSDHNDIDGDKSSSNKQQKDLKWDENNLEKNENEKVPRMKIDEPPTPYNAEIPIELQDNDSNDNNEYYDIEEVILDENPMDMDMHSKNSISDDNSSSNLHNNNNKTLDQKQQALLLADDDYRQKMVDDVMNRRQNEKDTHKKIVSSAWEEDNGNDNDTPMPGQNEPADTDQVAAKKAKFRNKRKAHYNEFHAIRAWRTKKQQEEDLNK